jgi:hypothetical protein
MKSLQRKAVLTWLVGTAGLLVLLWVTGTTSYERTFDECRADVATNGSVDLTRWKFCEEIEELAEATSLLHIANRDWTPGVQVIGATTAALVLFSAYLRIWKRPDGS